MPRPRKSSYGEDKPPYSYVALCAMAIHSSPSKMMMLSQIYKFIVNNFPFYRKNSTCWQNSLRHNLSFNDCFVKVSKSSEHGGKGNYWTLHHDCTQMFQDGSFLRRKRRFLSKEDEAAFFLKENNKSVDSTSSSMCPSSEFQPSSYPITPRYLPLQALEGHPKNDYSVISSIQQGKSEKPTTRVKSFSIADILGIDSSEKRTASTARYSDITVFPSSYSYSYEASKTDSVHDTQERYHPYSFHTNYQTCLDLYHKTKPATLVYNGSPWDANRPGQLVYCDNLKVDSLKPHPLTALRPKVIMKYEYQNKRCICHSF